MCENIFLNLEVLTYFLRESNEVDRYRVPQGGSHSSANSGSIQWTYSNDGNLSRMSRKVPQLNDLKVQEGLKIVDTLLATGHRQALK